MDIERKKELLRLAESLTKDIVNLGGGNYISKVLSSIRICKKNYNREKLDNILRKMKNTDFGGNNQKRSYTRFVDETLRRREYKINTLSLDELEFVFIWVNRILPKDSNEENVNKKKACDKNLNYDRKSDSINNDFSKQLQNIKNDLNLQ